MITHIYGDSFWVQQELEKLGGATVFHGDDPEDLKRFSEYTASEGLFGDQGVVAIVSAKKLKVKADRTVQAKPAADWIEKYLAVQGYTIEKKAETELETLKDPWRIKNELDKAMNYCADKRITTSDILITTSPKLNIFHFVDAVAAHRTAEAARELGAHLEAGTDPFYLHAMLVWKARKTIAKDLIIWLHDAEMRAKNGEVSMEDALWNLVL